MEEAGEGGGEGGGVVVDEGIEEAGGGGQREDIVVGDGRRNQGTVTSPEEDLLTRAPDQEPAVTLHAHRDDETVVFAEVPMERTGDFHHPHIEIRRVDDLHRSVGRVRVDRAVVRLDMEVERLRCQLRMQLARLAIHPRTVVVVDAVGDIARLLHLRQHNPAADGVDTPGREVEHIARLDLMVGQHLGDGAVGDAPLVFLGADLPLETGIEVRPFVGLDDVPHLRLAHLAMLPLRHLVVGMHLDAQVALGIDELHQQGQLTMVSLIDLPAQDGFGLFADDRRQVAARPYAIADDAGAARHRTHLPALAYRFVGRCQTFVGPELMTTPHDGVEVGLEEEWV